MLQSQCRRRFLWIVTAGTLVGIFIGIAPSIMERFAGTSGPIGSLIATLNPEQTNSGGPIGLAENPEQGEAGIIANETGGMPLNLPADRLSQQENIVADNLAMRERDVAVREEALLQRMNTDFWKRQLPAAAGTIALTMVLVLLVISRSLSKDGIRLRLRDEEAKLRHLQMSVISSLEEFERNLADARAWAAAEARDRNSGFNELHFNGDPATGEQPAQETEAPVIPQQPSPGEMAPHTSGVADSFFETETAQARGEKEMVMQATADDSFFAAPAFEEQPFERPLERPWEQQLEQQYDQQLSELPQQMASATGETASGNYPQPSAPVHQNDSAAWSAAHEASAAQSRQSQHPQPPQQYQSQQAPPVKSAAPRESRQQPGRESWARRFTHPNQPVGAMPMNDQNEDRGPWGEPVSRAGQIPAPSNKPPSFGQPPGLREQVEYLAAEGFSEMEIAKHLSVSRDEVNLALRMSGQLPNAVAQRAGFAPNQSVNPEQTASGEIVDAWDPGQWDRNEETG